ncbi:unnamed protein product, partial [Didymodactylos carnosus]
NYIPQHPTQSNDPAFRTTPPTQQTSSASPNYQPNYQQTASSTQPATIQASSYMPPQVPGTIGMQPPAFGVFGAGNQPSNPYSGGMHYGQSVQYPKQ